MVLYKIYENFLGSIKMCDEEILQTASQYDTDINTAQTIAVIESDDGPTAVFIAGKGKGKITKKKIFCALVIFVAAALLAEFIFSVAFCSALFSENGSQSFYEYAYGKNGIEVSEADKEWVSAKAESVFVENHEGIKLHALEIQNKNVSDSYVIICHQYGESALSMGEYAKHFYELGFNIILPDLRGHGESGYDKASMGWEDRFDIVKWVEYLVNCNENAKIFLFGVSMGGSAVAMTAPEKMPENVKGVIADSCYLSVWESVKGYLEYKKIPVFPTLNMASAFCEFRNGWSFKDISTLAQAEKTELPILYIHGEYDVFVPVSQSNDIFEACPSEKAEQVVIQDGEHARNLKADEDEYWTAVDMFILNNIGL